ncbi:hypothetical protein [Leptospira fluminis]|uniref:hypothetical protein n=1 Tax=Leptospira fluminis TaxID=2484979 RepID=UPI001438E0E6|nr:hypothetical protein [Leptospira fluminis]
MSSASIRSWECLYRSFKSSDLDENKKIKLETIKFPDISCNWSRFSYPWDIWYRRNGSLKDGCYSFSIKTARFKKIANPVHDPLKKTDDQIENYSHIEIRVMEEGKDFDFEPPKNKKLNSDKKKLEYRQNIQKRLRIKFNALH